MESAYGISSLGIQTNAVKFYYSKRKESVSKDLRRSAVARQLLGTSPPPPPPHVCDALEIGAFYEIDHQNLPPKSPIHLKAVRVVKVGEATKLDVTVSFPSTYSLRNYFSSITANPSADKFPELDERFVMSTNHAKKIIKRSVSTKKLSEEKHLHSFWLVAPFVLPCSTAAAATSNATAEEEEEEEEEEQGEDALKLVHKYSGNLRWGIRRKVRYIGRQQRNQFPSSPSKMEVDNEGETMRKRVREATRIKNKKKKRVRYEMSKDGSSGRGMKERWSAERYESAELKLLDIMREKGAVPGNSILRQELREEARKHIGDTGLLDHLLKHMAGKVVSDGRERFRRRHNSEGAMEYWLEPAELEELRKEAGVTDPFWVPPLGWKPGDATECQKEFSLLREEIGILKSDMEGLRSLKLLEKDMLQKYEMMLKKNAKLEEVLEELTSTQKGMKEEMELLKQEKENIAIGETGKKKGVDRRSGFRGCKPQGTFLWPSMASTGAVIGGETREYSEYQRKQLGMVFGNNYWGAGIPAPPSCSSATSTPKMLLLPSPTTPKSSTATSPSQFETVAGNNNTSCLASSHGDHQVKKREDAAVVRAAAWGSTITTDLVLATPSQSSI